MQACEGISPSRGLEVDLAAPLAPTYTRKAVERSAKIAAVFSLAGLLVTLTLVFGSALSMAAEPPGPAELRAQESVLRLTELPTGYVLSGRHFCSAQRPGEEAGGIVVEAGGPKAPPTPYEMFLAHNATSSCLYAYERLYGPPGPAVVFSFALRTPSVAAATEVLADPQLGEELATDVMGNAVSEEGFRPAGSPPALGEASLRFRTNRFSWEGQTPMAGTVVLWHQGRLVGGIIAGGAKPAVNDAAADRDGALQQKLMEAPRPYEEAESEDIPTFLDNPNLGVPVYWLGKEYKPGNGVAYSFVRADDHKRLTHQWVGRRMSIEYSNVLFLDSWTPAGWRRFSHTGLARGQTDPRCGRSRTLKLPEGHAVIYTADRIHRKGDPTCPGVQLGSASARVFLPGVVVALGVSLCHGCEDDELGPQFNSVAEVAKLVRSLRRWRPGATATLALAGPAEAAPRRAQIGMLLRFHELPGGYVVGDEGVGCSVIDPEGTEPPLFQFLVRHLPPFCEATYERRFIVAAEEPHPPRVDTTVVDLRTAATARQAEKLLPELAARLTGNGVSKEVSTTVTIGADTRLFHGTALVGGHGRRASLVSWRQGHFLGMTLSAGESTAANDREATRLARVQRAHMKRPMPYPPKERDDIVVPLENPAIELPIYWLGRSFDPGGGADPLPLTAAYGPLLEGEAPPGTKLELWYDNGALQLGTWTTESWQLYRHEKLGHELLDWKCTKTTQLPVTGGSATLYAGYDKNFSRCPGRAPDVFAAVVEVGGVVLAMGLPTCYTCLGGGPHRAELEAAVAALRLFHPQG
jgi:hypothetical protein